MIQENKEEKRKTSSNRCPHAKNNARRREIRARALPLSLPLQKKGGFPLGNPPPKKRKKKNIFNWRICCVTITLLLFIIILLVSTRVDSITLYGIGFKRRPNLLFLSHSTLLKPPLLYGFIISIIETACLKIPPSCKLAHLLFVESCKYWVPKW